MFVDMGSDDSVVNMLASRADMAKSINRSGLVQKQITYRTKTGKTATRMQWVRADKNHENKSKPVLDDALKEIVRDYTNGRYDTISRYSQIKHGGDSAFETDTRRDFVDIWLRGVTPEERKQSERLYSTVIAQKNSPRQLVRTELNAGTRKRSSDLPGVSNRLGLRPEVGQILNFGVKSSSMDTEFAEKVARNQISGLGENANAINTGGEILAFRVNNATRYLDVTEYSPYTDQKEALIAGKYKVTKVTEETITVDDDTRLKEEEMVTPVEYSRRNGLEIERFTSKKGNEMICFGTHTYPADYLDKPVMRTGEYIQPTANVTVVYIDMDEV